MSVGFGTSGLRGLVTELTEDLVARHVQAFVGMLGPQRMVMIARDLRPSSPGIAGMVRRALVGMGVDAVDCGRLPTPAMALAAQVRRCPAIMVTGSHIPADRNGLKFYSQSGEVTKAQEAEMARAAATPARYGGAAVVLKDATAAPGYLARYRDFFGNAPLAGMRLGVWQHSSVARDLLVNLLAALGATPVALGRSDRFVPIDTEAISAAVAAQLRLWSAAHQLDAILSTDGDADRPLLAGADGALIPGDVLGVLTARALGADCVVTPVTSCSMIETSGAFAQTCRTRIGSPHVIAGLEAALRERPCRPAGFEANGGFVLGFAAERAGRRLAALPTRDAFLPLLAPLVAACDSGVQLEAQVAALPPQRMASGRLAAVPTDLSRTLLDRLARDAAERARFFADHGPEAGLDLTDGLRVSFVSGVILHLRPSGNAPELRGYAEAANAADAEAGVKALLARARAGLDRCG